MPAWPDPLRQLFARVAARRQALAIGRGAVIALVASLPMLVARLMGVWPSVTVLVVTAVALVVACALAVWRSRVALDVLAAAIEARTPVAKNLLVTAAELATRPSPIRADVREVVLRDAADVAARIDAPALFPARRVVLTLAAVSALWIALFVTDARWMARARDLV
ncbi:MAG: hypothetical protein K8S21_00305, partial [Gemmatimonadetes bacterium]|nr:hypothetical protein [Gemmatimonadota bacterium]